LSKIQDRLNDIELALALALEFELKKTVYSLQSTEN